MDRHPSTQKRHRQSLVLRSKNRAERSALKTARKNLESAVGTPEAASKLAEYSKLLDKATKHHILHKRTVARKKSQCARLVNKSQASD